MLIFKEGERHSPLQGADTFTNRFFEKFIYSAESSTDSEYILSLNFTAATGRGEWRSPFIRFQQSHKRPY